MGLFRLSEGYEPTGDQPQAIAELAAGVNEGLQYQTLLGATATGKTFTMANVIAAVEKPTLVIAHNKTLAAQLCNEFREFFPDNAVEYFVSYYDYYQPEAYLPSSDTYIEKDSSRNEDIDRLRHAATSSLLRRRDVVIVASVSCIYGLGSPSEYEEQLVTVRTGESYPARQAAAGARRHPVPPQRHGARPRALPRARRRRRGAAGVLRDGLPRLAVRRRGRVDHALRPAHAARSTRARTRSRSTRRRTT